MTNQVVGNYKILEKIGEGGMGEVLRGVDLMLEREVAIKSLRPEFARRQDLVERFRTEAIALARLNHPNIATLYSFVRQGDSFFMVMEFVRGRTLDKVIAQSAPLSWHQAVPLFCQALQGIAHAHHLGVVHRDIKPANIMLAETGTLKVLDFGIARLLGTAHMTKGHCFGTLAYMSPEQIRGQDTDARTDVYTLGIVLYEMLTGRVPFTARSEYELIKSQVEEMPTPPRRLVAQLPVPIEDAVMRSLAKAPDARFQSADEFRTALQEGMGTTAHAHNVVTADRAVPITRSSEPPLDILSSAAKAQNRRNQRWPLSSLRTVLPNLLNWTRYPGVIAMLVLVSISLGLMGVSTITQDARVSSAPAGVHLPPPFPAPFAEPQPEPLPVSSGEAKQLPSYPSPQLGPSFIESPLTPSLPETGTISDGRPHEEEGSEPKEPHQENKPSPKQRLKIAKSPGASGKSQWKIIK